MIQLSAPAIQPSFLRTSDEIEFIGKNKEVSKDDIFKLQKGPYAHLIPQLFSRNQIRFKIN